MMKIKLMMNWMMGLILVIVTMRVVKIVTTVETFPKKVELLKDDILYPVKFSNLYGIQLSKRTLKYEFKNYSKLHIG